MKNSILLLLVIGSTSVMSQSFAQCRVIEFAELQSMKKKELEQLFCNNMRTARVALTSMQEYDDLANRRRANALERSRLTGNSTDNDSAMKGAEENRAEARQYRDQAGACVAENDRVLRAIRKGNDKIQPPKCD